MISKILDVTDSGAGPPFEMLYLLHFTNTTTKKRACKTERVSASVVTLRKECMQGVLAV